jgi:diketogulonate reductase-like aldo/keto reductase
MLEQQFKLADGNTMPVQGFGLYKVTEQAELDRAIQAAWENGYRLFDTAQMYGNEAMVGAAINQNQLQRAELFLTTKIAEANQGYDQTLRSFEQSLRDLQVDYVDLLLVHWPLHTHFFETWQAFERLKEEGLARSIGVSNYSMTHLQYLATKANMMPVVDQIEVHPLLNQADMIKFNREQGIVTQAWAPLGRGRNLDHPVLQLIAQAVGKTTAQVILRWHLQNGISMIPKSVNPARIKENASIYDFELTTAQMEQINELNSFIRISQEPELVYERGAQYPH